MKNYLRALIFRVLCSLLFLLSPRLVLAALDTGRLEQLLTKGKIEEARDLVVQDLVASSLPPAEASVDNIIGWTYYSLGNVVEAENFLRASFKSAVQLGDEKVATLAANNIGIVLFSENRLDEADVFFSMRHNAQTDVAIEYRKLIEAKRRDTALSKALEQGKQQRYELKFRQAVTNYETALLFEPGNVEALEYKGYALFRLGRFNEALDALWEARSIDPTREMVHLNIVKVECARRSEDGVQQAVDNSKFPLEQVATWYQRDGEFVEVCGQSAAIKKAMAEYYARTKPSP